MSKKIYTFYSNCQGEAIAKTLEENTLFSSCYEWLKIKPIQNIKASEINSVSEKIATADVIIHQTISDRGRHSELSSQNMLKHARPDAQIISIPSLYFDGYFPHLSSMNQHTSVLSLVHDYFIAYAYCKGISPVDCLGMIRSEVLYSRDLSEQLLNISLNNLRRRESKENLDITISDYIEKNFKKRKLFNQFNHPTREVFEFISNQILKKIGMEESEYHSDQGYLDGLIVPIYQSTYKNLGLQFIEDFNAYETWSGHSLNQRDIVFEFYDFYKTIDMSEILDTVCKKKPFVPEIVDRFWK